MTDTTYNGWANYETWNVALWIGNDEGLQALAQEMHGNTYQDFVDLMRETGEECGTGLIAVETPDKVAWNDSGIDHDEMNDFIRETYGEDDDEQE